MRLRSVCLGIILIVLAACSGGGQPGANGPAAQITLPSYMRQGYETYHETGGIAHPADAVDVFIVYAPETQQYMPRIIEAFNQVSAQGKNPVTGEAWANGQKHIFVAGQEPVTGSSGSVAQGIVNAVIAP